MAKNWIAGATKNKGALRRQVGAKKGENISDDKLDAVIATAKKKGDTKTLRRAILAKRLRAMKRKGKKAA